MLPTREMCRCGGPVLIGNFENWTTGRRSDSGHVGRAAPPTDSWKGVDAVGRSVPCVVAASGESGNNSLIYRLKLEKG